MTKDKPWIGLDIGGANIKLSTPTGSTSHPFELWKQPNKLCNFLREVIPQPLGVRCAVTMTGELADGYESKELGVARIVAAVEELIPSSIYYQTSGKFVDAQFACLNWLETAAANWHASALWLCNRFLQNDAIVIDMGSTTTDITIVRNGAPLPDATTDFQRLSAMRLIYTGSKRSSLAGIVQDFSFGNQRIGVANEVFATIEDAFLILGELAESGCTDTADGRPKTVRFAKQRVARMLCSDVSELGDSLISSFAMAAVHTQKRRVLQAMERAIQCLGTHPPTLIICGEGEWLVTRICKEAFPQADLIQLSQHVDQATSDCAAAVAVRELASEKVGNVTSH